MHETAFNPGHIKALAASLPDRKKGEEFRSLLTKYGECIYRLKLAGKDDRGFLQAMNSQEQAASKVGGFLLSLGSKELLKVTIKSDEILQKSSPSHKHRAELLMDALMAAWEKAKP